MLLIRLFILTILTLSMNVQISFGQRAASSIKADYYNNIDSTKKILPADENEFSVDVRILSDDLLEKYKNDPDFNYR